MTEFMKKEKLLLWKLKSNRSFHYIVVLKSMPKVRFNNSSGMSSRSIVEIETPSNIVRIFLGTSYFLPRLQYRKYGSKTPSRVPYAVLIKLRFFVLEW